MVDIIIPVFNGYDFFKNCLESILKYTNTPHRIIVINDKSKEELLLNYLGGLKKSKLKNLIILNNKKNLGFVKSVNIGMKFSKDNDVLLLNSDTVVTKDWLKKLHSCAYSSETIATVTPLSNNAAYCSVPDFERENEIPEGFTIDSFAALIEEKSLMLYPEIPTGVGFCMYVKREALDSVGFFEEKYFGRGYGEENDFCMRAKKAGFVNALDDSTFVYHKGSGTFTETEKRNQQKRNLKILDQLHPDYFPTISNFYLENPLKPISENISSWLQNYGERKRNILYVKHFEPAIGGVGINLQQILYDLREFNLFVFTATATENILLSRWQNSIETGTWEFKINRKTKFNNMERDLEVLFRKVIDYFSIDLIHFHHLRGFPLSMLKIPKLLNLPSIISLHDYFLLSSTPDLSIEYKPNITYFFREPSAYLRFVSKSKEMPIKTLYELSRMKRISGLLDYVDMSIAPSNFVKTRFKKIFPKMPITLIEHGIGFKKNKSQFYLTKTRLNIAFLGGGALNKGIVDFIKLSKDSKLKGKYSWKIIGGIDYKLVEDSKLSQDLRHIKQLGSYKLNKLPEIIKKEGIDIIMIPSTWPETYSYTLSESIQLNIPVIARNIGALGERTRKYNAGWTFNKYEEAVKLLRTLFQKQHLIADKVRQLNNKEIAPASEMTHQYAILYNKLMSEKGKRDYPQTNSTTEYNRFFYSNFNKSKSDQQNHRDLFNHIKMFVRSIPIVGSPTLVMARKLKVKFM